MRIPPKKSLTSSQMIAYLTCILACSEADAWHWPLTFQTFDDEKPGGVCRPELSRVLQGTPAQLLPKLERLNRAGAGIFITVNGTDGKGRRKANIRVCLAWYLDLDTKGAVKPFDLSCGPLEPTMVVKTPGGFHVYYVTAEAIQFSNAAQQADYEGDLKRIQAALADYGADPKAGDVGRVLRLPGFMHRKSEPCMVELVMADGPRYTLQQIRDVFPPVELKSKPMAAPRHVQSVQGRPANWQERVAAFLASCESSIQGCNGSRALFSTCMKLFTRFDLTAGEVVELVMTHYNIEGRCVPLWSLAEVEHKAADADLCTSPVRGGAWREGRLHE